MNIDLPVLANNPPLRCSFCVSTITIYDKTGYKRSDSGRIGFILRKTLIVAALAAMTLTASACNTVCGIGDDLKSAADAVDEET